MAGLGLVAGTWGNLSLREGSAGPIAITPSGRPYNEIFVSEIVIVDSEGQIIDGCNPSSETPLHLAVYKSRPDVNAIAHTHSLYATACAVAGVSIPPLPGRTRTGVWAAGWRWQPMRFPEPSNWRTP